MFSAAQHTMLTAALCHCKPCEPCERTLPEGASGHARARCLTGYRFLGAFLTTSCKAIMRRPALAKQIAIPQLNSKAIPFKLDHVIPSDELTHDWGCKGMLQCTAMQMFGCRLLTAAVLVL